MKTFGPRRSHVPRFSVGQELSCAVVDRRVLRQNEVIAGCRVASIISGRARIQIAPEAYGEIELPATVNTRRLQKDQTVTIKIDKIIKTSMGFSFQLSLISIDEGPGVIHKGEYHDGTVVALKDFGAFVDIGLGKDVLLTRPGQLRIGERVSVVVTDIEQTAAHGLRVWVARDQRTEEQLPFNKRQAIEAGVLGPRYNKRARLLVINGQTFFQAREGEHWASFEEFLTPDQRKRQYILPLRLCEDPEGFLAMGQTTQVIYTGITTENGRMYCEKRFHYIARRIYDAVQEQKVFSPYCEITKLIDGPEKTAYLLEAVEKLGMSLQRYPVTALAWIEAAKREGFERKLRGGGLHFRLSTINPVNNSDELILEMAQNELVAELIF